MHTDSAGLRRTTALQLGCSLLCGSWGSTLPPHSRWASPSQIRWLSHRSLVWGQLLLKIAREKALNDELSAELRDDALKQTWR